MTKTIELQGNSPKYQQEYSENDFQIEKKNHFLLFSLLCTTNRLYDNFCDFYVPILTGANQRKLCLFFTRKDIVHWSKKITRQSHDILEPTQKV